MSCADVQTIQPGNGVKTQFSFDFPYIFKSEIKISFWNATTKEWDDKAQNDATYPWQVTDANPTIVEFTGTAPPTPAVPVDPGESAVDNVRIRRVTNIDDIRALFNPGSAIRSDDLNRNFEQLRYAIQESNCQGITEDVYQYLLDNYWDRFDNTVYSTDTWVSDDTKITTTQSIDQRIDNKIDDALTIDIDGSDGITIADDTPSGGQIVVGIGAGSVDLDRIKDEDILTYAEQEAGTPFWDSDGRIPTTYATARRFDTLVQPSTPVGSNWSVGKTWLQNNQDLTLSIWNGSAWLGVASGGTFTNQPKVVYVDASSGDDNNDGHRISRPKLTIKAAIEQINADATYGDGSVVVVAPGVYREVAPIDITKKDVSVIGTALRSCIIHPTSATETNTLFRVNSGTFLQNLTFTGVKATGTRGGAGSIDLDPVYGLPVNQGWNVSFYPGALIYKSPYIQNCTNFSDSEIDNNSLTPHIPGGGSGGDLDSAPTGGGLLIDGSVVASNSPLRSMVCDSYTHVGLDGPGILVTNNGYCQATSSYSFFNHYHIKCVNGGQANLAGSTTDFGRYGLVADGRSTNAIFTAVTTVDAADGDISFTIGAPVAGSPWHGSATRPQSNMLVDIGGNTYPILSATPNGAGWDVVISRPNALDKAENLGLDGAVLTGAAVSFYLRSMLASSGHTMEYVGSGTNYTALPENGGVPIEANQVVELNNGKVWTATTDHNGKFKVGDFFTVDQQTNAIFISSGSFNVDLQNLQVNPSGNAVIGANLDLNGSDILDSTGNVTIADTLDMNSNAIINLQDPSSANHAATKNYVDTNSLPSGGGTLTGQVLLDNASSPSAPDLAFDGDTNTGIYSPGADQVAVATNGTGRLFVDASGNVGVGLTGDNRATLAIAARTDANALGNCLGFQDASTSSVPASPKIGVDGNALVFKTNSSIYNASERLRITDAGLVGIGTSTPGSKLEVSGGYVTLRSGASSYPNEISAPVIYGSIGGGSNSFDQTGNLVLQTRSDAGNYSICMVTGDSPTERLRIDSSGRVGIGTTSPGALVDASSFNGTRIRSTYTSTGLARDAGFEIYGDGAVRSSFIYAGNSGIATISSLLGTALNINGTERARIDSSGRFLVGTSSARANFYNSTNSARFQIEGSGSNANYALSIVSNYAGGTSGAQVILAKSGGSSVGDNTLVLSGNTIGQINFQGADGTEFVEAASIKAQVDGTPGANDMPGRLVFSTTADGASFPTERMRIDRAGQIFTYTTGGAGIEFASNQGAGNTFDLLGGKYNATGVTTGTACFRVHTSGDVRNTNNSYGAISDIKLKENIVDANSQWDDLRALQVRNYNFKEGQTHTQIGLIAQEVELVSPGLVSESPDRDEEGNDLGTVTKSVNYSVLYMKAVKALQEAMERIETLEGMVAVNNITIDEQQHQLSTLAARLTALESA